MEQMQRQYDGNIELKGDLAQRFSTGAELLARLMAGSREVLDGYALNHDVDEGIWVTNPYGIDCGLLPVTEEACQKLIDEIHLGDDFGPVPF